MFCKQFSEHSTSFHVFNLPISSTILDDICIYVCTYIFRQPSGFDKDYFIKIDTEFNDSMTAPSTQLLLIQMFKEKNISFTKVWNL